jgi:murein DD-endopeptidase MepM/ murein hydrolase activator NlpD
MSSVYRPQRTDENPFRIYAVGDNAFSNGYQPQAFPGELPRRKPQAPKTASMASTSHFAPKLQRPSKARQNKAWIIVSALLIALFGLILAPSLMSLNPSTTSVIQEPPSIPEMPAGSSGIYMVREPQVKTRTVKAVTYDTLSIGFPWFSRPQTQVQKQSAGLPQPTFSVAPVINGILSSPFGERWRHRHQGIDIAAPWGSPIYSTAAGKVVYSGWMGGYGQSLLVDHGKGYKTRYAHCSKLLVRKGQRVKSGQMIAKVGSSGHSTGPHLHFEVLLHGIHKNPGRWFRLTPPFAPLSKK